MIKLVPAATSLAVMGGSFLAADKVAKNIPPTAAWALGWGSIATVGTLMISSKTFKPGSMLPVIAATGVALAYLHAFVHQTPYPHKS